MAENITITDAIRHFFEEHDWQYEFHEEEGFFESGLQLDSELGGAMIHAVAGPEAFTVMIAPDIAVEEALFDDVREFINGVNARLMLGCLVLDTQESILFFRMGQNCIGQIPSSQIVEDAFMYPISFLEEIGDTLAALLTGKISAAEAGEQALPEEDA
jgi:hypothetical protein